MRFEQKGEKERLRIWKDRLGTAQSAYQKQLSQMDEREALYKGSRAIKSLDGEIDKTKATPHVRNIVAELIEAQVDSNLPAPKVTPRRKEDEHLAEIIENMLRDEMDRLSFELINDQAQRTVPIQGGSFYLLEWDNTEGTQTTVGENALRGLHPKQVIPQDGVTNDLEEMDYIFVKIPTTKAYIRRRYDKDVDDEAETEPQIRGSEGQSEADDMVTQIVAYFRNDDGGIGLYSWAGDTELECLDDYQARRLRVCAKCGEKEPPEEFTPTDIPTLDGSWPGEAAPKEKGENVCPICGGSKWEMANEEFEEIWEPITRTDGKVIPGAMQQTLQHPEELGEDGQMLPAWTEMQEVPTRVPYYKPDIYPIVLQKNVSVFGQLLGDSDVDKIRDQQLSINRLEKKIQEKLMESGSVTTLPVDATVKNEDTEMRTIRLENAADKSMIDVITLEGDVSQDMAYMAQVYEEARQIIGITDSFQGRKDATATSGKAKEFSAAQAAGRLESKRRMREAAYARLFEVMFKFSLAYADEPRPVAFHDDNGDVIYEEFNRYDFLEQDATGRWYWNDQFLFSCDTSAPLAANREAMWQETRMNLQTGAFGDPTAITTLILFWARMEELHYPGAATTKKALEAQLEQQRQQQQMMAQLQMQAQLAQQNAQRQMAQLQQNAPMGQQMMASQ